MVNEYVCYPAKFASPLSSVINWLLLHVFSCQQFICRWSNLVHMLSHDDRVYTMTCVLSFA